jgi:hypothetical protein
MRIGLMFCALLTLAAPALAQSPPPIALVPGEAVTFRIDQASGAVSPERGRADWQSFDVAVARHLSGIPVPDAPVPFATPLPSGGAMPAEPPVVSGRVRAKLLSIAGQHSLLVLENGYARAIAYRARMTRGGRSAPTDVCVVIPHRHGFEHWPHSIDRLEIYDFRFVEWKAGDPVTCA